MPRTRPDPSPLDGPDGSRPVYLLDVATGFEERLLERWLSSTGHDHAETIRITSSRRGRGGDDEYLSEIVESGGDELYLIPLRIVWMAPKKRGRRAVTLSDMFKPGDPRDPRGIRARLIRFTRPGRVKYLAAQGAFGHEMVADHHESDRLESLSQFVTRRAWRVLDRAERQLRGNRYKIPRFIPESILSRRDFVASVEEVARRTDVDTGEAMGKAEHYLREIAATHSPYVIDLIAAAIHKLYRMGYGEIKYSDAEVRRIASLGQGNPVVFLPSHRSNLDRLSLQYMLWENDLPPNHTAGGINLNFFPVGPLVRRTGVFFIRRSFRDNELYKTVLRSYLDYLIEKRFPLEWYMEGGRSRSGKLLPPRLGMLNYVVDSWQRGKSEDIQLVPVSIAYDQIQDVPEYAREAGGEAKEKESIGWLVRAVRSLRKRYGDIHIRFGPALSVAEYVDREVPETGSETAVQRMALEVMYRIGQATPVTPTALMSIALLADRGAASPASLLADRCAQLAAFVRDRHVTLTEPDLDYADDVVARHLLQGLSENGYVSSHEAIGRQVFWLDESQMVKISYYRNMVVHFFLLRALSEMALTRISRDGGGLARFEQSMLEFRDLLKFEFFFSEKEQYLSDAADEVSLDVPWWRDDPESLDAADVLAKLGPPIAYWAVLPFLDAYQVVGDELEATKGRFNEKTFLKACLARSRMYRIEGRLISGESGSQVLFKSALSLAANRALLDDSPDVAVRRAAFASEVRAARDLAAQRP